MPQSRCSDERDGDARDDRVALEEGLLEIRIRDATSVVSELALEMLVEPRQTLTLAVGDLRAIELLCDSGELLLNRFDLVGVNGEHDYPRYGVKVGGNQLYELELIRWPILHQLIELQLWNRTLPYIYWTQIHVSMNEHTVGKIISSS